MVIVMRKILNYLRKSIPFEIFNKHNRKLIKALKEAKKMEKYKGYHDIEKFLNDLES